MSRVPGWLGKLGARLTEMSERLDARQAEVADEDTAPRSETARPRPATADTASDAVADAVPHARRPSATSPPVPRPDPAQAVPWGVRVAAEAGWRLLVLAGTVWVLMRVISAIQLVVFAFVIALLITALLQPTVARLTRRGVPRGPATALTAISGFVVIGLMGWFVTWQVMENIDTLSNQIQSGIDDLRNWLLRSPFHVTDKQINQIAKNLREAIGANADQITSAGLEGVQVIVEALTGILLVFFSTLFLLYDGKRIWSWFLKLVPSAAREGVAGAGPRAWRTLTAYVRGTVLVALIDATFIGIGIYFLDVPMAVPLAVFIFLFSFIPLVGAVASGALAVIVALVTQGVFTAVMTLVVVLAVQQIEGHVLQPFILGRAVRVHPLAVVLTVAAGGMVAGIGGAVVAVPLVAVTNTVVGYLRQYSEEMHHSAAPALEETAAPVLEEPAPVNAEDPAHQG
ncbi:AI-2E family transporter [Streptomyces incarnatus]|uniref:AI-2E family transporter n=1 Tax=unclassified Streptomyces TaxID=2593676 RepID=UPI00119EED34|nr:MULTISPECIES: AI-2E family transporter [Streptomyces]QHC31138.1 AI-2E family transporter [Streptomyces sp. HF10]WKE69946.1 AI-2E family transporter [Streptomyces sp. WP-1]